MKHLVAIVTVLFMTTNLLAQVSGHVVDDELKPMSLATITLQHLRDSMIVQTKLSDENGDFSVKAIASGAYLLRVHAAGFLDWQKNILLSNDTLLFDAGTIQLIVDQRELQTVKIKVRKPSIASVEGGLSIDVSQSPMTPGSTILAVLGRQPGILVDPQGNDITLNGKSGVMLMLDGKLLRLPISQVVVMLGSMPADNLARIEVLSNPPARYDAEGAAGIINIITQKTKKKGTSGSLSEMIGFGKEVKTSTDGVLFYHQQKTDIQLYYDFDLEHGYSYLFAEGTENNAIIGGKTHFQYNGTGRPKNLYNGVGASFDQQLTPHTKAGVSFDTYLSKDPSLNHNYGNYQLADSNLVFNSILSGISHSKYIHPNFYLETQKDKNRQFRIELDYLGLHTSHQTGVNSNFTDSLFSPVLRNVANSDINVWVAKIDLSRPLSAHIQLEAGVKGSATLSKSRSEIDNLVNGQWTSIGSGTANDIATTETIGAAYLTLHWAIDSLTNLSAGSRYEYTHNGTEHSLNNQYAVDRKTSNLFPSIFLRRRITDRVNWQIAYTQRIKRPSYSDLASYVTYNDPVSVFTGNPALRPSTTSQIRFSISAGDYVAALSYSHDSRPILGIQGMPGPTPGLVYLMPENGDWQKNLAVELIAPIKAFDWWKLQVSWYGAYHRYHISFFPVSLEKGFLSYSTDIVSTMKLGASNILELSAYYNSASFSSNSRNKGSFRFDMGYKHQLHGNWGSLQTSISDIFRSSSFRSNLGVLIQDYFDSNVKVLYQGESSFFPVIKISYTRHFGNNNKQRSEKSGTGEEQQRM